MAQRNHPSLPEDMPGPLRSLVEEVDLRQQALDAWLPKVMSARRTFFVEGTDEAKAGMEAAIASAQAARRDLEAAITAMLAQAGIDPEDLEEEAEPVGDPSQPSGARRLSKELPPPTPSSRTISQRRSN